MALKMEYKRKIEYYIQNIPKRMYKPVGEFGFDGFFTYDRLSLKEAIEHEKQILPRRP